MMMGGSQYFKIRVEGQEMVASAECISHAISFSEAGLICAVAIYMHSSMTHVLPGGHILTA